MAEQSSELILKLLAEKAVLKNKVFQRTADGFKELKNILQTIQAELRSKIAGIDKTIEVSYADKGEFEVDFSLAGDTIVFLMHTNVFTFEHSHPMWKTSYIQDDNNRSFCGKIYIYNFLSDSFKYERKNDVGYLIARIFINSENHFFVEGKRQLGFLYNDFANAEFTKEQVRAVAESAILYSLDFDPFAPPYNQVNQVSVHEILESTLHARIATGKRLGFRFHVDNDTF